jgi:hypothetical protein
LEILPRSVPRSLAKTLSKMSATLSFVYSSVNDIFLEKNRISSF